MRHIKLSGVNIQQPWAHLILSGLKLVETRSYPLPTKFKSVPMAVIETPGKHLKGPKAQITGIVQFSGSFRYGNKNAWAEDYARHLIEIDDPIFGFREDREKWAWVVCRTWQLIPPQPAPTKKGIIFAKECSVFIPHFFEISDFS